MQDQITIVGSIGATPEQRTTKNGDAMLKFRVASNERKRDSGGNWIDGETSWYSVVVFGTLARNAAMSFHKGQRVIVRGTLVLHEYTAQDQRRIDPQITAVALGHELTFGTTVYARTAGGGGSSSGGNGSAAPSDVSNAPARDRSEEWAQPMGDALDEPSVQGSGEQLSGEPEPAWFSIV